MAKRKKPTFAQRTTPCVICTHPISQQHHIFEFASYGDSEYTIPLCANCHELFHLIQSVYRRKTKYALEVVLHALTTGSDSVVWCVIHLSVLVLVRERQIGLEYKQLSQRDQVLLIMQKFPTLFDAYKQRNPKNMQE
jgi:hypothetical protein